MKYCEKMLYFLFLWQPLEIDEFVAELKSAGVNITSKDVIDFLDEQVMKVLFNYTRK